MWAYNTTTAALSQIVVNSSANANPTDLTNVNGTLYFSATGTYVESWKCSGTRPARS